MQKIADASEQLAVLNDKLAIQKVAVTEKTEACEILLEEILSGTEQATQKKKLAQIKGKEIEEQNKIIVVEKVNIVVIIVIVIDIIRLSITYQYFINIAGAAKGVAVLLCPSN